MATQISNICKLGADLSLVYIFLFQIKYHLRGRSGLKLFWKFLLDHCILELQDGGVSEFLEWENEFQTISGGWQESQNEFRDCTFVWRNMSWRWRCEWIVGMAKWIPSCSGGWEEWQRKFDLLKFRTREILLHTTVYITACSPCMLHTHFKRYAMSLLANAVTKKGIYILWLCSTFCPAVSSNNSSFLHRHATWLVCTCLHTLIDNCQNKSMTTAIAPTTNMRSAITNNAHIAIYNSSCYLVKGFIVNTLEILK